MIDTLSAIETRVGRAAFGLAFAAVESVQAVPKLFCPAKASLIEQRKGVGEGREARLENASRLREIGWGELAKRRESAVKCPG